MPVPRASPAAARALLLHSARGERATSSIIAASPVTSSPVPGNYILVDHALSRAERGLLGIIQAEGAPNPEIFEGKIEPGSGH